MDNSLSHLSRDRMDVFTTAKVWMVVFAWNATHIFHLLDLKLFVTFKWVGKYHLAFDDLMSTSRSIYRQGWTVWNQGDEVNTSFLPSQASGLLPFWRWMTAMMKIECWKVQSVEIRRAMVTFCA
jgi:hypothetical protein